MTTGEIIKAKREERHLTQAQLAEKLGNGQSMVAQYERGSKIPTVTMAKAMSSVFECTVDEIAG